MRICPHYVISFVCIFLSTCFVRSAQTLTFIGLNDEKPVTADPLASTMGESHPQPFSCYKKSCTKAGHNETCTEETVDQCARYHHDLHPACFVLWENTTKNGVWVYHKGCWDLQRDLNQCRPESCTTDSLQSQKTSGVEAYFCCCEKPNCNKNFYLIPKPKTTPLPKTTPSVLIDEQRTVSTLITTLVPICLLAVLICTCYYVYRRYKMCKTPTPKKMAQLNEPEKRVLRYEIKSLVAKGRFGRVYQAIMDNQIVAVKVFPQQDKDSWAQEQDIYKVPLLATHDNILHFIAADVSLNAEYLLFTTYHQNGSIYDYIKAHMITFKEMLHVAVTMIRGLAFLHEEKCMPSGCFKPTIVHRDFKSHNVLLKKDLTACVSDFGLALKCDNGRTPREAHGQVGTRRYMAPEVLQGATELSAFAFKQIDVYAAALVLWELLSRCTIGNGPVDEYKLPYEDIVGSKPTVKELCEVVVVQQQRPKIKETWMGDGKVRRICETIQEMWDAEFEARVTAGGALERFLQLDQPLNSVSFSSLSCNDRASAHETSPLISDLTGSSNVV